MTPTASPSMNQPANEPRPYIDDAADHRERTHALWTHLAGLLSIATAGIPILGLIVTTILWKSRASDSPFLDDHGREALNFQITIGLYWAAGVALASLITIATLGIVAPLVGVAAMIGPAALTILTGVGCVRGAIAANKGEYYRYPMCIRCLTAPGERA